MAGNCFTTLAKSFLAANLLLAAAAVPSIAGDTRGYVPAPPGTAGVLFYYWHTSGNDRYKNGDKVATDFNLDSNLQILRPVYYSSFASMPVSVQALIPFGDTAVDGVQHQQPVIFLVRSGRPDDPCRDLADQQSRNQDLAGGDRVVQISDR